MGVDYLIECSTFALLMSLGGVQRVQGTLVLGCEQNKLYNRSTYTHTIVIVGGGGGGRR